MERSILQEKSDLQIIYTMRFSKYILALLFITSTILVNAQQADTSKLLTIQQCLDIAIKNNLQVKQSNANAQLARIDYRQAIENLLPNIGAGASRSYNTGRAVSPLTNAYINQSATNDSYSLS